MDSPADQIFARAVELEASARAAYLDSACGADTELRLQVERMLVESREADAFFAEAEGATLSADDFKERYAEKEGDIIGPYKLRQLIGEGGFGVVWMAEQFSPISRMVALKVIKAGMDTRQVLARFEAERQALAMMDHPNIARVLDAGATASGRPYFAMELVKGIPITDYCDSSSLGTRDRLGLFSDVCAAINHAHQKGVIHRDIKPSNVMVTLHGDKPVAKVIDFGIAKATQGKLTDKTLFTRFEQIIGTPSYMSPEQAALSGLDIDTRSDIYGLGILLYELLTGRPPFDSKSLLSAGYAEMQRIIREVDPPKPSLRLSTVEGEERTSLAKSHHIDPSKLTRLVEPDLDWIVMKAIEKDRSRRYETANALSQDIRRFLAGEPVSASPPSTVYRFKKFVKRHKLGFASAAAIISALVLGLGLSLWQSVEKTRAHQRAMASEQKSREVAGFLKDMLDGVGPSVALGRDTTLLKEILDKTAERIGKDLNGQPEVELELRNTLGDVYRAIAENTKAEAMHRRALELGVRGHGEKDPIVADSKNNLALVLIDEGNYPEAEKLLRDSVEIYRQVRTSRDEDLAASLNNLGMVLRDTGRLKEADTVQRESIEILRACRGDGYVKIGYCKLNLAIISQLSGRHEEAEDFARSSVALFRKVNGNEHPEVATALANLALVLRDGGKLPAAEQAAREALAMRRKLLPSTHPDIAKSLMELANMLNRQDKQSEAESCCREALDILRERFGPEHRYNAFILAELGRTLEAQGKLAEAARIQEEALAMRRKLLEPDHPDIVRSLKLLSLLRHKEGHLAESESLMREALAINLKLMGPGHRYLIEIYRHLGKVTEDQKRFAEAERFFRDALDCQRKNQDSVNADTAALLECLARTLAEQEKYPEGERCYREALAACEAQAPVQSIIRGSIRGGLGGLLVAANVATPQMPDLERQARFGEAEKLLISSLDEIERSHDAPPGQRRAALEQLSRLYTAWNDFFPDPRFPLKAAGFQQQLAEPGRVPSPE
ncbi:serine/threonine-protein kinase [Luteolibacter luteus]|uniref:Serine/threonine protein kinase n=1 Tax=Luteolibacter luteus TaxID=2728835 RepID=A0A858RP59_9BACT|nr:serine/threonine-protein kinase [Luteolibacter luteus]QJE98401.1 serine/threonine protein kinase [Luteolibacter luteus]